MRKLCSLIGLLGCMLVATQAFGGEKRKLVADQFFGCKKRKLDQKEEFALGQVFHQFSILPQELQNIIILNTSVADFKGLFVTNKALYSFVKEYCCNIFSDATAHKNNLNNVYEMLSCNSSPCLAIRKIMSGALFTYRNAHENYVRGNLGQSAYFSKLVLAVKFPAAEFFASASDDKMMIEN